MVLTRGLLAGGSLTLPRMNAHRLVIAAAALTVAVAAALSVALATFSGQALPHAVRHDLATASGTSLALAGAANASQAAQYSAVLPSQIKVALEGTPFAFYHADWSDPLGFVPGSQPAAPPSAGNQLRAEAAALGALTAHAVLVSGHWPGVPGAGGQPIPAALPATAATLLRVKVGDVLRMRDLVSNGTVRFVVTGLYRPRQVSSEYWALDSIALTGSSTASGFTTYGPLTVQPAAFGTTLPVYAGTWLAQPAVASIPADQLTTVAANVDGLRQQVQNAQVLPALALTTSLPAVLNGTATDLDVARSLLAICAILLALLAGAALLAVARLLAAQREVESAMLTARGATRWQLVRLTAAEAVPLCLIAAALGGLLGVVLARLLAGTELALGGGAGLAGTAELAVEAAAVVAAGALVILLVPALTTVSPGTARAHRGRQAAVSRVTRAGADLALVLLAVLAGWELRHYSAVSAGANGNFGVDPVVVIAPALALLGGTVVALRLLPAGGRAGDRLAARGRGLTAALASWQISRQPIRQGGAALLIVLAVATGTLVLAQRQSWTTSEHDQAAFGTGADVRVETTQPLTAAQAGALVRLPGVRHAMPVATFPQYATSGDALAVDSSQAGEVTLLRADQSALPAAALFGAIRPSRPAPGVTLPGDLAEVGLTARLGPASLGLAPAIVNVSVQDAAGDVYLVQAGTLPADGRDHTLAVSLTSLTSGASGASGASRASGAVYPLRLTAVSVDYTLPPTRPRAAVTFAVSGLSGGPGTAQLPGTELAGWMANASSSELVSARETTGTSGPSGLPATSARATSGRTEVVAFDPGYGMAASPIQGLPPSSVDGQLALTAAAAPVTVLPGIATQGFLAATNASVGSTVQADFNGEIIGVRIVARVATFPTVSASGGALIVDLATLQQILTSDSVEPAQVTQWWLATTGRQTPPGLAAILPSGSAVTSAAATEAALVSDPLSEVPQRALLAVAIAAVILAITGFCVSIAAGVHQRRAENALLAALGVPPRAAAGQLCLEKLMLSLPSALAGLVLGVVLAELLVPAITLTSSATTPIPPVLIQFPWAQTLLLALAVAVLPVLAASLTVARRPDAAAELRAAEAG
jgi:FtsX-like permease family